MLTIAQADAICDGMFTSPFAWERSRKGNLWRRWNNKIVTVFARNGFWYWSIKAGENQVTFSKRAYRTEQLAMSAVMHELEQRRLQIN